MLLHRNFQQEQFSRSYYLYIHKHCVSSYARGTLSLLQMSIKNIIIVDFLTFNPLIYIYLERKLLLLLRIKVRKWLKRKKMKTEKKGRKKTYEQEERNIPSVRNVLGRGVGMG